MEYKNKYYKYKNKYLYLKKIFGGYFGREVNFDERDENITKCKDINNDFFKASVAGINYYTEEKFLTLGSEGRIRNKLFEISKNVCIYFNKFCESIINHFIQKFSFSDDDFIADNMKLNTIKFEKYTGDFDYIELLDEMLTDTYSYLLRYLVIIIHMYHKYKKSLPDFIKENDQIPFFYFKQKDDEIQKLFEQRNIEDLEKLIPKLKPIFENLNKIMDDTTKDEKTKKNEMRECCKNILLTGHTTGEIHIITGFYFEINYNYQLLTDRRSNCSVYNANTAACLYKRDKEKNDVGKNVYFNEEQLSRLRKFKEYNILIDNDELHKKQIGITLISVNKNKIFFNKFYKRGFLTASGPSGSIPYFVCLFLIISGIQIDVPKIKTSDFILMCLFYMGIRCDHSLFEMILTMPWNIFSIKTPLIISESIEPELYEFDLNNVDNTKYIKQYFSDKGITQERQEVLITSIKKLNEEWNKFNQTIAWVLLQQIVQDTEKDKEKNYFQEIDDLLNDRIEYIKKICV